MSVAARDKARREFDDRRCIDVTLDVYARLAGAPAGASA
jgi:hypothetical protein